MKKTGEILLLITALIWGVAFVAQSTGGDAVGPFTFNCIRSFIGSLILIPVINIINKSKYGDKNKNSKNKELIIPGIFCGSALAIASALQQLGITWGAEAGKAGFLTAFYIILVPIMGLFLKKKCGINVWIAVLLSLVGLYLLCIKENVFYLNISDILLLLCAFCFSIQILLVDYYSPKVDGVKLSCIQFLVCGIINAIPMLLCEMIPVGITEWLINLNSLEAWISILYAGVMSCGVAYTLQIIGQSKVEPTIASLLMSLESVFSVLAGWLILGEKLAFRALLGCLLIFIAVLLSQIHMKNIQNRK